MTRSCHYWQKVGGGGGGGGAMPPFSKRGQAPSPTPLLCISAVYISFSPKSL